ncbi:MAG: response regulator transcription factor [Acidobacteria bacterium]|nr:response regulator transcription factor [Acidobacteriota bacterium]
MPIRVAIADDEAPARGRLKTLLAKMGDIEIIGEASDGDAAVNLCANPQLDILFLDIRMPEWSGLDVAAWLQERGDERPFIIIVSAYDQHALEAFELEVLDYLTKPIRPARLEKALNRARARLNPIPSSPVDFKMGLPYKERTILVAVESIHWVQYENGVLAVQTADQRLFIPWNLKQFEEKLQGHGKFIKISRQTIVNLDSLKAIDPMLSGTSILEMKDGTRLEASRSATTRLKTLF